MTTLENMKTFAKTARKTRPNGRTPNALAFHFAVKWLRITADLYRLTK